MTSTWSYLALKTGDTDALQTLLDRAGKDGWELVAVLGDDSTCIFKRPGSTDNKGTAARSDTHHSAGSGDGAGPVSIDEVDGEGHELHATISPAQDSLPSVV